jgi:hypothetical protein
MANLLNEWIDAFCKSFAIYHETQVAMGLEPAMPRVDKDQLAEQNSDKSDIIFSVCNAQFRQKNWWDDHQQFLLRKN